MTLCYEGKGSLSSCNNAYTYLKNYRDEVSVPSGTTPWYIPSVVCWNQVALNSAVINERISAVGGEKLVSVDAATAKIIIGVVRKEMVQLNGHMA